MAIPASRTGHPPRLIGIEEVFADPVFSGASISPDGTQIAYLAPAHGRMNVWVRGIDQEHDQAVCVTHDARRGIKSYYWTGDSRWLLYRQDTDGNEDWHVYRVDLQAPEQPAVDLTPLPPGSRVMGIEVRKSVPGSILVGMNRRPMFFDCFQIDVATGETTLYREQSELTGTLFGADGRANFYSSRATDGTWEYYAVDEKTGEKRLIYRAGGASIPLVSIRRYRRRMAQYCCSRFIRTRMTCGSSVSTIPVARPWLP